MTHEFDGAKYAKVSTHQKEWGRRLIETLDLKGDESILDLGCGDGFLTSLLADQVPKGRVIGIDSSCGMIESARGYARFNLEFELRDIAHLNLSSSFDLIYSNAVLHWVSDHDQLLADCYRLLRAGGRVRFNFAASGNCSNFNDTVVEVMKDEAYLEFFEDFAWPWYMPELGDYKLLVSRCSFSSIKVWEENLDRYFPSVDAMVGWVDQPSIVPFLKVITDESKKREFRDEVVFRMTERTKLEDGSCFETFRRINVDARKSERVDGS